MKILNNSQSFLPNLLSFNKKMEILMKQNPRLMTRDVLTECIYQCKKNLRELEKNYSNSELKTIVTSQPFDAFSQYCEELIDCGNLDRSDVHVLELARALEAQLERVVLQPKI